MIAPSYVNIPYYGPQRSIRGLGAEAAVTFAPQTVADSNKRSGLMIVGLGALIIVGGFFALRPKSGW